VPCQRQVSRQALQRRAGRGGQASEPVFMLKKLVLFVTLPVFVVAVVLVTTFWFKTREQTLGAKTDVLPVELEFLSLSQEEKEYLVSVAYKAVDDYFDESETPSEWKAEYDGIERQAFVGFWVKGTRKGSWSDKKGNLAEAIYSATRRTLSDIRFDGSLTKEEAEDLRVMVYIIGDFKELDDNYEPGIYGLRVEKEDKGAFFYNSVAIENNWDDEHLKTSLCLKAGLERNCFDDPKVKKYYFPTLQFGNSWFSDRVVTYYRSNLVDDGKSFSRLKVEESLGLAKKWLMNNVEPDGLLAYEYYPSSDSYAVGNSDIRQLLSSRYVGALAKNEDEWMPIHEKNLDYIFDSWYEESDAGAHVKYLGQSSLGANAMFLRTLVYSPLFEKNKEKAQKVVDGIVGMQFDDGAFRAYLKEKDSKNSQALKFYSGEAILALMEFYGKTSERQVLDVAKKSQEFYLKEYVEKIGSNFDPSLVPWQTFGLYHLYNETEERKYVEGIYKLNDRLVVIQNQSGAPFADYLGHFKARDWFYPSNSASTAVFIEGLIYAFEIARGDGDVERAGNYRKAIIYGLTNLTNLQFKKENMYYLKHFAKVEGGIRTRVYDNTVRVDNVQHTIDAFEKVLEVFEEEDYTL